MTTFLSLLLVLPSIGSAPEAASLQEQKTEKPAATAVAASEDPALKAAREFIAQRKVDKSVAAWKTQLPKPPQLTFDPASDYFWQLDTNKGPIKIRFMPEVAPMHVSSTIFLTEIGFYDGLTFHRVIPGFMAQGGCPLGTGTGSPGYTYDGEFDPNVKHDRPGMLSMANTGRPQSDGSQFFITFVPTRNLDGKHTIFGEMVAGMETLKTLESMGSPQGKTKEPLVMSKCTIVVEPKPKKEPPAEPKKEGQQG